MGQPYNAFIKDMPRQTGLQVCPMMDGYCITAFEKSSDARSEKLILLHVSGAELDQIIQMLQGVK